MLNRGGPLSKLVSGTIGLAKEYSADRHERKAAQQAAEGTTATPNSNSGAQSVENHEQIVEAGEGGDVSDYEDWILDLDEAQTLQASINFSPQNTSSDEFDMDFMLQSYINNHPPRPTKSNSLSMDVLLPQRRIKSQHKGFVRAYAPVLGECGIDQDTWLEFLDGFEKSISKNSWFHVTNAAILLAGTASAVTMGISPVLHMVSMAIHTSIELSRRGHLNFRQNQYLDIMNAKFFKPRGLFCMVIKYKPSLDEILEEVDLQQNITKSIEKRDGKNKWKGVVSSSDMIIKTDVEISEPAPLIFPELDQMSPQQETNSIKRFGRIMQDYMDRRAAATFDATHPDSKLPAVPPKEFASVYGDPNSAANSGGFISLATGGKWNSSGPSGTRHDMRRDRRSAGKDKMQQRKGKRPMSKMLKSEAMYLMVTNVPSQDVLDHVGAEIEKAANRS